MTFRYDVILLCALWGILVISQGQGAESQRTTGSDVKIDLRHGVVKGDNPSISFISRPTEPTNGSCNSQTVIRVSFPSPDAELRIRVTYEETPYLWTLHVSDSPTGDGFGGNDVTTSNNAELNIHNKQLRLYGNDLPNSMDAAMNGGRLMKVYDNFVKKDVKVTMDISDERFLWKRGKSNEVIESPFLFTLSGQSSSYGVRDDYVYIGLNRVVRGTYRAGSGLCRAELKISQPIHRCSLKPNCHPDAKCFNTRKSYRCKCKPGFNGDGKVCKDDDECVYDNGGCVHTCINTPGSYTCACKAGFVLMDDGKNCQDINECFNNKGSCSHQCINTLGSFQCGCNAGFSLDDSGRKCVYGQWCRKNFGCSHGCSRTSSIGNKIKCYCRKGYSLHSDGKTCLRTCNHGNGGCNHHCNDTSSGPVCSCAQNYFLNTDKTTCTASCAVKNGGCERKCLNTPNGPVCSCPVGFKLHLDGKTCLDVNECETGTASCSHQCENTRGSFECICPPGYKVGADNKQCIDIDECNLPTMCDHHCENLPGSFTCHCSKGYQKFGLTHCADRNECADRNGGCAHKCTDTDGSYKCSCVSGFKLHPNKHDCIEERQCIQLTPQPNVVLSCSSNGNERRCVVRCKGQGRMIGKSTVVNATSLQMKCGPSTGFHWTGITNETLPECSYVTAPPSFARVAKLVFVHESCSFSPATVEQLRLNMTQTFNKEKRYKCKNKCRINYINLKCGSRRKKFRKYIRRNKKSLITAEFELQMNTKKTKASCDALCTGERTRKRFMRAFKKLRRTVKRNKFVLRIDGKNHKAIRKSLKSDKLVRPLCPDATRFLNRTCVGCTVGSFFNKKIKECELCPPGTYQDEDGRSDCKECPTKLPQSTIEGAASIEQCSDHCEPGTFSQSGKKPCQKCGVGTFQPNFGRVSCAPCDGGLSTVGFGSTDFSQCRARAICKPGTYYSTANHACVPCQRGFYQPIEAQEFCLACPGKTTTDFTGSKSPDDCKDTRCGRYMGDYYGIVESPNYPGNYPINVQCVWKIRPEQGRRILVIVPEIDLSDGDRCEDIIIMRKSKFDHSASTFETCESRVRPIAFTARSRKLWIQFKSNKNNTAKGFSIPFVTYNEDYDSLIEDIVRDGRLYSSKQHQQIFKDRQLLTALLEVIATPYKYLNYANVSHTMFPQSFIKLLTPKVRRFFDP